MWIVGERGFRFCWRYLFLDNRFLSLFGLKMNHRQRRDFWNRRSRYRGLRKKASGPQLQWLISSVVWSLLPIVGEEISRFGHLLERTSAPNCLNDGLLKNLFDKFSPFNWWPLYPCGWITLDSISLSIPYITTKLNPELNLKFLGFFVRSWIEHI